MREWLSKDFNPPSDLAGRIAKRAVKRAKKRKAIEKTAMFFIPFLILGSFAFFNNLHLISQKDEPVIAKNSSQRSIAFQSSERGVAESAPSKVEDSFLHPSPEGAVGITPSNPVTLRETSKQIQAKQSSPIKFQKVDHSLEISWEGEGEFVIYKCDSPKFDKCSVADVVEGNRYLDKDDNSAKIIYYRIEPLKKG